MTSYKPICKNLLNGANECENEVIMIVNVAAMNNLPATSYHLPMATFLMAFEAAEANVPYICAPLSGTIAQLVEQRIENPCVPGSNPGGTTIQEAAPLRLFFCIFVQHEPSPPNRCISLLAERHGCALLDP